MDTEQSTIPRRLHYLKCTRCRSDKKQVWDLEYLECVFIEANDYHFV
jgi:hypothetical protein